MRDSIYISLADDNAIFREGLKMYLQRNRKYIVEYMAENGLIMVENLPAKTNLILMDIEMPVMDGLKAAREILKDFRHICIIAITMYREKAYLEELIKIGFKGCVFKQNIFNEIDEAIDSVMSNRMYFPTELLTKLSYSGELDNN